MQRLSQMVLDMQARMTDMSSNLRLDFQEDASKMMITLLNNLRQPAGARGSETQTIQLPDFSFDHETASMDEVMNKISQVTDDLESKSNTLDDLLGRVNHHDEQIRLLMEAAQTPQSTPPPSQPDLRSYLDDQIRALREELMEGIEIKLADLKNSCDYKILSVREQCEGQEANYLSLAELMDSKETDLRNEIQDLKDKLVNPVKEDRRLPDSVVARVEKLEIHLNSSERILAAQCLSVESKLKKEQAHVIKDLRNNLEDKLTSLEDRLTTLWVDTSANSPSRVQQGDQDILHSDVNSLKDSVKALDNKLNALDQLCSKECKTNVTLVENLQQDFESCRTAVDTMETSLGAQINDLRSMTGQLLNYSTSNENIQSELSSMKSSISRLKASLLDVENQEPQILQILNSTWGLVKKGTEQEAEGILELFRTQHQELRQRLDELGGQVKAEADHCRGKAQGVEKDIAYMDSRIVIVERLCDKLQPISSSLQRIKEGLNKHVAALWTCVNQLNGTVGAQSLDIGAVRGTCQNLQNNVASVAKDLQVLLKSSPGTTGKWLVENTKQCSG